MLRSDEEPPALSEAQEGTFLQLISILMDLEGFGAPSRAQGHLTTKGGGQSLPLPCTHLVTGGTAGSEELGVVPAAVDPPILLEVDEIHQLLVAEVAGEAGRVPEVIPQARRRNPRVPFVQPPAALRGTGTRGFGAGMDFGDGSLPGNGCWRGQLTFLQGQPWQGPGTGHARPCPRASCRRRALKARSCCRSSSARSGQNRSCGVRG